MGRQRRRWHVEVLAPVADWLEALSRSDIGTYEVVTAAINLLEEEGPALGRPMADRITGSRYQNLKELRPQTVRILFVFDPLRQAVLLVGGDKRDRWDQWYEENIPLAERRYDEWLASLPATGPAGGKGRKKRKGGRS